MSCDRHVAFLHGLQECCLGFWRGSVDFVGKYDVAEDRACGEAECASSSSAFFFHQLGAGDVTRHEVGRELHAGEAQVERLCDCLYEQCFRESRCTDQDDVSAGEQCGNQVVDNVCLADDALPDLLCQRFVRDSQTFEQRQIVRLLCSSHQERAGVRADNRVGWSRHANHTEANARVACIADYAGVVWSLVTMVGGPKAALLMQRERHLLADRVILAVQQCDECVVAGCGGAPLLIVDDGVLRTDEAILHGLREHASFAPAPDLAAGGVEHDEIVCASVGEVDFDALAGAIVNSNCEANFAFRGVNTDVRSDGGIGACARLGFTDDGL